MAGGFLRSHGVDIDSVMARIQNGVDQNNNDCIDCIQNVSLPDTNARATYDVHVKNGRIEQILEHQVDKAAHPNAIDGLGALLAPSLCHPHIHLDKAYLLSHPKYSHLQIGKGDFQEAMTLTGQAKAHFEHDDLLQRGQRLIEESVTAGVTHMRAFFEVDAGVGNKCLEAGIALKREAALERKCNVQICAFAQLPLFSRSGEDEDGAMVRGLMESAAENEDVDVIGSTPYVESDRSNMEKNVEWMIDLSMKFNLHLDFHLDYNLDFDMEPLVWHVVKQLKEKKWTEHTLQRTIVLGHCTRLALFHDDQWEKLALEIQGLPISFVGLPTSDLFMMRTGQSPEIRGTLNIPHVVDNHGLNACIGVNNIGNAFTPQGSCDPLSLACQGVGIYQAGTKHKAELLYECVSTRAKAAIGFRTFRRALQVGDVADFVLFRGTVDPKLQWRTRKSISEAVYLYDQCQGRRTLLEGRLVNST